MFNFIKTIGSHPAGKEKELSVENFKTQKSGPNQVTRVEPSDFIASVQPGVTRLGLNEYLR